MPLVSGAFNLKEIFGKKPRDLFTFARADRKWYLTSANAAITIGALTFEPALISRGRIQRKKESAALVVHVRVSPTTPIAAALSESRTNPMLLGIHRYQQDGGRVLHAYGDIRGVTLEDDGWLGFDLVTLDGRFSEPYPGPIVARQCWKQVYSGPCGVDETVFSHETTIISIDRSTVIVDDIGGYPGLPDTTVGDGWYDAGQLKIGSGPSAERIYIRRHTGPELHLAGRLPTGVEVGDAVTLLAGDTKTIEDCRDRFNNVERFGGFNLMPVEDPLQTGVV